MPSDYHHNAHITYYSLPQRRKGLQLFGSSNRPVVSSSPFSTHGSPHVQPIPVVYRQPKPEKDKDTSAKSALLKLLRPYRKRSSKQPPVNRFSAASSNFSTTSTEASFRSLPRQIPRSSFEWGSGDFDSSCRYPVVTSRSFDVAHVKSPASERRALMRYATPVWNRRDTKYSVDSSSTDWGSDSFDRFPSNPYNVCPPPYEPEADYDDDESAQSTPKTLKGILKRRENNNPSENVQRYIQYGPGIVRRLKERFSKISGAVSQDAEISPHSRRKRYPSVDDILSTDEISTEQARRNHLETSRINGYHQSQDHLDSKPSSALPLQAPTSSPVARNEKSSCAPHGFTEAQASYIIHNPNRIHRLVPVSVQMVQQKETLEKPVDDNTLEPISLLRAKFEHSSRRTDPKIDVRPFRSLSSAPYEKENEPLEPEFLRVHRQLKKTPVRPLKNDRTSSSDHSDLYGANEFYEISPPPADPLPTRAESQNLPVLLTTNDRSPPPEEPKHHDVGDDESLLLSDSDTASYDISAAPAPLIKIPDFGNVDASDVKDTQNKGHDLVTSKINFSNDDSGVGEMHRLLNRFRKTTPAPPPPTKLPSSNIVSIAVGGEESRRGELLFLRTVRAGSAAVVGLRTRTCDNEDNVQGKSYGVTGFVVRKRRP
ncbi:hypothetical protein QR680_017651 [Steinernema hermaphroditum]|uniref:Uncharacterized protein n=1 Tax=Steinernema hermaphroditum TaxID=289476 RepID=A0AA39LPP1_9BILA|nr:hypothetical protein QR680_017651 [Steinernema hermaphroditum]